MKNWKTTVVGMAAGASIAVKSLMIAYENGQFTGDTGWHLISAILIILLGAVSADSVKTIPE